MPRRSALGLESYLPIVVCLARGMRERTGGCSAAAGLDLRPEPSLTRAPSRTGVTDRLPTLEEVAAFAAAEFAVERSLDRMHAEWRQVEYGRTPTRARTCW